MEEFVEENGEDISSAKQIYELVKERVEKGDTKFLAVSHNYRAVGKARDNGIPVKDKLDIYSFFEEL